MMMKNPDSKSKAKEACVRLLQVIERLKTAVVFVEGKRDKEALLKLDIKNVLTVSGNLRISGVKAHENGVSKVIVLTDMDERGNELAYEAKDELERYGIKCDLDARWQLSRILGLKYFEDIWRKYVKFMEIMEESKNR